MADDPRIEPQNEARYVLDRDGDLWRLDGGGRWVCLTTKSCSVHPSDLANVLGPLRELVTASEDPLRALLADEDRAAIAAAAAFYRATSGRFWTDLTADDRRFYLALNGDGFRAVLAALREVAGP